MHQDDKPLSNRTAARRSVPSGWAHNTEWSDEEVDQLRALWEAKTTTGDWLYTTPEIGRKLGCSKSRVVGKAHRLRLTPRPSPIRAPKSEPQVPRYRQEQTLPPLPSLEPSKDPCHWPIGDPGTPGFRYCDAPAEPGRAYCTEHCGLAFHKRPHHRHQGADR